MQPKKEEFLNSIQVLEQTRQALLQKDAVKLKELSDKTTHSSVSYQDEGSILVAVLVYTLSKIIEREDYKKIKNWEKIQTKINMYLGKAVKRLEEKKYELYEKNLKELRKVLENIPVNIKSYITDILRKAAINKGAKFYEHGLSLGKITELLGITQWELSEYTGQKEITDMEYNNSLNVKKRAETALEFFS